MRPDAPLPSLPLHPAGGGLGWGRGEGEGKSSLVLFLVGPTASGKSELAVEIARRVGGEIISADSMQIYRGMNIGTAKPTKVERRRIPHHLIDVVPPSKGFSAFEYRKLALVKIREILESRKIPIVSGGSGLYVRSLLEGWTAPNPEKESLRALGFEPVVIGLARDRAKLYERIEKRVDQMFRRGFVQEVKKLAKKKLSKTARQALGYKEILAALTSPSPFPSPRRGEGRVRGNTRSLDAAKALIKKNTRHFAKRQMTWFRKEKGIQWVEWKEGESIKEVAGRICRAIKHT